MARACMLAATAGIAASILIALPAGDDLLLDRGEQVIHVKLAPDADVAGFGEPLFERPAAEYQAIAAASSGTVPDLSRWRRLAIPSGPNALATILAHPDVVTAFEAPTPELASVRRMPAPGGQKDGDACPVVTPSYEPYQGYLGPAPLGIDAPAAWVQPGGTGSNVWFADIEGGWNSDHEDLPGDRITHVSGRKMRAPGWVAHGTAVLGEVAARDNDIGMVGIAPNVERIFTASIGRSTPARAIDAAQARMRQGDVLLIELHAIGPRGRFLPMEFWDDVYEAIVVATSRGIVVIEAAGNGGENLDHEEYAGRLGRADRDSGAIMVGAGAPPRRGFTDRSRLDFSNYGTRLDVQGWGRRVATLDYGDLQSCGGDRERNYTDLFSGTSSASPVVAGAALLVQSIAKERGIGPLPPRKLRSLLSETGSPQTDGPHGPATQRIGPRPDLAALLDLL